ncbi:MAG: hypothetical protein J4F40_12890 [Alphaproteobacteria bacterium]|nr:hypothetical protein [Alphaproteobacteria bacterium]
MKYGESLFSICSRWDFARFRFWKAAESPRCQPPVAPPGQADQMTLVQLIESIRVQILDPILDEHCDAY